MSVTGHARAVTARGPASEAPVVHAAMPGSAPPPGEHALRVDRLRKQFDTAEGAFVAVDGVSFAVRHGEFVSVIGPSGCGKSTLFNIIGGLLGGHEGEVRVGNDLVTEPHPSIGMVFQEESTFPWRTVLENVAFPLEIAGVPRVERSGRARHFIELVGLAGFERSYPAELSGGMRDEETHARQHPQGAAP
jgi:NitT/TauT family transport system ATP-binding protein